MNIITYHVGKDEYRFNTPLRLDLDKISLIAFEHYLIEEIKKHKHSNEIKGIIHDVVFWDDSGDVAYAKDFEEIESLTIIKKKK